jgi:hypothetical protein
VVVVTHGLVMHEMRTSAKRERREAERILLSVFGLLLDALGARTRRGMQEERRGERC